MAAWAAFTRHCRRRGPGSGDEGPGRRPRSATRTSTSASPEAASPPADAPEHHPLYDYGRTDDGIFFIAHGSSTATRSPRRMQRTDRWARTRHPHRQQICRSLRERTRSGFIPPRPQAGQRHDCSGSKTISTSSRCWTSAWSKFFSGRDSPRDRHHQRRDVHGSPHYIAPEQARNQSPDQRCDIYSLGVLLVTTCSPGGCRSPLRRPSTSSSALHDAPVRPGSCAPIFRSRRAAADRPALHGEGPRAAVPVMDELLVHLKAVRAQPHRNLGAPLGYRPQTGPQPRAKPYPG